MEKVKFQSVDELLANTGREIAVGNWHTVTQQQIDLFAEATGDYQWIHLDRERARAESPYGTTIAHGFLTLSMIPKMMEDVIELPPAKMSVNYGLNRVRFAAPVPAESRIRLRITLMGSEDVAGGIQLKWRMIIEVQGSEKPACIADALFRLYS